MRKPIICILLLFLSIVAFSVSAISFNITSIQKFNDPKIGSINYKNYSYYMNVSSAIVYFKNNTNVAAGTGGVNASIRFEKKGYFFAFDIKTSQMKSFNSSNLGAGSLLGDMNPKDTVINISNSSVIYKNAWNGTDIMYNITKDTVKETLIITSKPRTSGNADFIQYTSNNYFNSTLRLCLENGTCYSNTSATSFTTYGRVNFVDNRNITIFYMPKIIVYDSAGNSTNQSYYAISNNPGAGFVIDVTNIRIPKNFTDSAVYPLYIDPTIVTPEESLVQFISDNFAINSTLYKWNGTEYYIAPNDIFINSTDDTKLKFGAIDYNPLNTSAGALNPYKYVWNSTQNILFDGNNYYLLDGINNNSFNPFYPTYVENKWYIDTSDICKYYSNCSFTYLNNSLILTFLSTTFIDPSFVNTYTATSQLYLANATEISHIGARLGTSFLFMDFNSADELNTATSRYVKDSSINNNFGTFNLTNTNPIYNSSGGYDGSGAYQFDGVNDYIQATVPQTIASYSFWYKPVNLSSLGGTISYDGDYTIQTFTSNDNITIPQLIADMLIVAGGGSGGIGGMYGGGGGAGGYQYFTNILIPSGIYNVNVGTGGISSNGQNSSLANILSIGGGKGGDAMSSGNNGGSGGGGGGNTYPGDPAGGIGIVGQGKNGGAGHAQPEVSGRSGGGGGGSIQAGRAAISNTGGNGGNGTINSINGTAVYYAGGGGGSGSVTRGIGGLGGGANAGLVNGFNATNNTGGGGGGGTGQAGKGGSGIIILRYLTADTATVSLNWTHIAYTNGIYYVNGIIRNISYIPINITGTTVRIGVNGSQYFNGSIDQLQIFGYNLTAEQVLNLYNGTKNNSAFIGKYANSGDFSSFVFVNATNSSNWNITLSESANFSSLLADGIGINLSTPNLVSYWKLDGNYKDIMNIKNGSGVNITNSTGISSNSVYLNGVSSTVNFGASQVYLPNASNFSVSLWFQSLLNGAEQGIFTKSDFQGGSIRGWIIDKTNANLIRACVAPYGGVQCSQTVAKTDTLWHHLVAVFVMNSSAVDIYGQYDWTNVTLYYDNVPMATSNRVQLHKSGTGYAAVNQVIGKLYTDTAGNYFKGSVNEVMFYNRSLSVSEVDQLYKSGLSQIANINVTLQTRTADNYNLSDLNLVSLWDFNNDNDTTVFDEMNRNNGIRLGSIADATENNGTVGRGYSFDGTNDNINFTTFPIGTITNFTFSAWIYPTRVTGNQLPIYAEEDLSANLYVRHYIYIDTTTSKLSYDNFLPSGGAISGKTTLDANRWTHIVISRSANNVSFYKDGAIDGNGTGENPATPSGIDESKIGKYATFYFAGSIDEVKVYNRSLSASEVLNLYQMENYHILWGNWSDYNLTSDGIVKSAMSSGKFMQYKLTLSSNDTTVSPYILNYSVSQSPAAALTNFCLYSGVGNLIIQCNYYCNFTAINMMRNNITLNGSGVIRGFRNISNYTYGSILNYCNVTN